MIPSTPANNRHTPSSLIDTSLRIQPTVAATVTYFFMTSRDRGTFNPPGHLSPAPVRVITTTTTTTTPV